jgi:YHS domain-containing protein
VLSGTATTTESPYRALETKEVPMTCAVCNKTLTAESASAKTTHNSKQYYFCCEGCEKKYEANREQYAKP